MGIISLFSSIALIVFQVNRKSCVQNVFHSSASRAFVTRKRFSACWENSPIPIERCLRHRAAHPFRMLQRQFLPKKKARCRTSITPTLHRTFHHRLLCLFSSSCRTSCSCSCSFFLLILFQDFLHNLLRHKPILHFRFGLAVLCIGAFLSFQKHRILCVQLADARELFVRAVLFLISIKRLFRCAA